MPYEFCDSSNIDKILSDFSNIDFDTFNDDSIKEYSINNCSIDIAIQIISIFPNIYYCLPDKVRRSKYFLKKIIDLDLDSNITRLYFIERMAFHKTNDNINFYIDYDDDFIDSDVDTDVAINEEINKLNIEEPDEIENIYTKLILDYPNLYSSSSPVNEIYDLAFVKKAIHMITLEECINDRYFIIWLFTLIDMNSEAINYISIFLENKKRLFEIIKYYSYVFQYISEKNKAKKNFIIQLVNINGLIIKYLNSVSLKNDIDIVQLAVAQNGLSLKYVNDNFRNNIHIVSLAIHQNINALKYALPETILKLVKDDASLYNYISPELKDDHEFIKRLLNVNHSVLSYLPPNILRINSIVYPIITKNGLALKFTDIRQYQKQTVLLAVKQNGLALEYAKNNLNDNIEIVSEAIKQNGLALQFASENLKNNIDIVFMAINENAYALEFASPKVAMEIIKQNGMTLQFVSDKLKNDIEFVFAATEENIDALQFAPENIQKLLNFT